MGNLKCCVTWRLLVSILCGFCVMLFCQCTRNNSQKPVEIHLLLNRHPFTESILRFIPEYERKNGVKVSTLLLSEEEYFEKLITELSSRSSYYDLFMLGFPHLWQYAKAGWLEPLDPSANPLPPGPVSQYRPLYSRVFGRSLGCSITGNRSR